LYKRQLDDNFNEIQGEMLSFLEKDLESMWGHFRGVDRIIGFNTLGFDVPALKPYSPPDFPKLPHFDIYLKIKETNDGRASSLNRIAKDTLGETKNDDPANAIHYWHKGDPESLKLLQKYCESDVYLTKAIYDFGMKNKYLKFTDKWNNPRTATVDFSYPPVSNSAAQPSLF
jgi:DEAD/DEAH box helicase domain-containing protein